MSKSVSFEIVEHVPIANSQIRDLAQQVWQQLAAGHPSSQDKARFQESRELETEGFYAHRFVGHIDD